VLVFGGSQGAHAINVAMVAAAPLLKAAGPIAITHQTGERDLDEVRRGYAAAGLDTRVEPFLHAMDREMADADLVIARAGATTIAELTVAGRPAVLVPLPTATDDHQRKNAEALARLGAVEVVLQAELSGAGLAGRVTSLLGDASRLQSMRRAARAAARPDAADVIAERVLGLARRRA
jgi:UDP-N-acetylglucosamine--N-acetylmuramyl-(pentapeptide) pyrophosphoryl-undecaprenol N-acetylglucosamine transferase